MPPRRSARNTKPAQEVEATVSKKRDHSPAASGASDPAPSKKPRPTTKYTKKAPGKISGEGVVLENELKAAHNIELSKVPEAKPVTRRRAGATPVDPLSGLVGV
jgi:hypothetical protein